MPAARSSPAAIAASAHRDRQDSLALHQVVHIDPKDESHPVVELLTLIGVWLVRAQRAGVVRRGDPRHLLIHVLGLLQFYPAIAHDVGAAVLEADPFSRAQVRIWKRELRHALSGVLSPAKRAKQ